MRPLVRSEQVRVRLPKQVKDMIKVKANDLGITITAYLEALVVKDYNEALLTKDEMM
jgi:hypothetical protein